MVLLIYVVDVILTGTLDTLISQVKDFLYNKFKIKDLSFQHYFLGLEVAGSNTGLFLNQRKYALELVEKAYLSACKLSANPMDPRHRLGLSKTPILADPTPYRRLVEHLIYLTITRPDPDLAYSVHILSQFMVSPNEEQLQAPHKVLHYLKNAPAQGLLYSVNNSQNISNWVAT